MIKESLEGKGGGRDGRKKCTIFNGWLLFRCLVLEPEQACSSGSWRAS